MAGVGQRLEDAGVVTRGRGGELAYEVGADVDADLDRELESALAHHAEVLVGQVRGCSGGSDTFELFDQVLEPL